MSLSEAEQGCVQGLLFGNGVGLDFRSTRGRNGAALYLSTDLAYAGIAPPGMALRRSPAQARGQTDDRYCTG